MRSPSSSLVPFAVALALALAVACGDRVPHPVYSAQTSAAYVEVPYPPPPARAEAVPAQPSGDAVWVDGEWSWRGRRWIWTSGRWVVPPQGATFSPWASTRGLDGTFYLAPGAWRDAKGAAVTEPKALAYGSARASVLFEADLDAQRVGPGGRGGSGGPRGERRGPPDADGGT